MIRSLRHTTTMKLMNDCTKQRSSTVVMVYLISVVVISTMLNYPIQAFQPASRKSIHRNVMTPVIDNKTNMDHHHHVIRFGASTVEAPTKEQTKRKTGNGNKRNRDYDNDENVDGGNDNYNDMEYLMDPFAVRGDNDPFHILMLGSTFEKPKVTVPYVSNSLEYVLGMPTIEGIELSTFAKENGMSCLGTWTHEECISLGKQLQVRDIVCRVVPYCEGGQRGWQAKDASSSSSGASSGGFLS